MSSENHSTIAVKTIATGGEPILGHSEQGGLVMNGHAEPVWLRHSTWRYREDRGFGADGTAYTGHDITENGYPVEPPLLEITGQTVESAIEQLRAGELPPALTTGVEVEGSMYEQGSSALLDKHDGVTVRIEEDPHPELLSHIVEDSTNPVDGRHLHSAVDVAVGTARAVQGAYHVADLRGGRLTFASVTEGGEFDQAKLTNHPYLKLAAPRIWELTDTYWDQVPDEAIQLMAIHNQRPRQHMRGHDLNWPVMALHVHSGVPRTEGMADPRVAHAMAQVRQTEMAKLLSLGLYNTRHMYGVDTELRDVRSVARRFLASAHDSQFPGTAAAMMQDTIEQMRSGQIHSPSRYPARGQHDRTRFRMEQKYQTVESIDAPMNPDLRLIVAWAMEQQVMNAMALEALAATGGDESQVLAYLQAQYGDVMRPIPTLGRDSSYSIDQAFNADGYAARINGGTVRSRLQQAQEAIAVVGRRYDGVGVHAAVAYKTIERQMRNPQLVGLDQYLGIAGGHFEPNGLNEGIVTDHKAGMPIDEIIEIQHQATRMQAAAFAEVRDEQDLLALYE